MMAMFNVYISGTKFKLYIVEPNIANLRPTFKSDIKFCINFQKLTLNFFLIYKKPDIAPELRGQWNVNK